MNETTLKHLTERALSVRNEAARLLAEERQNKHKIAAQLQTLQQYRADYATQLQIQMQDGIAIHLLSNYQNFLSSLDNAVVNAKEALLNQEDKVNRSQQQWQTKQRKVSSYETLAERQRSATLKLASKREQKLNDELSIAMHTRQQRFGYGDAK